MAVKTGATPVKRRKTALPKILAVILLVIIAGLIAAIFIILERRTPTPVPTEHSDFEKYGITPSLEVGVPVIYTTRCDKDHYKTAKGTLTAESYTRGPLSAESLIFAEEKGLDLSDYEELTVSFVLDFFNEEAAEYDPSVNFEVCDYYNITLLDGSSVDMETTGGITYRCYTIKMDDEIRSIYYTKTEERTNNEYSREYPLHYERTVTVLVPNGYDGVVLGYIDNSLFNDDSLKASYIFERYDPDKYFLLRLD